MVRDRGTVTRPRPCSAHEQPTPHYDGPFGAICDEGALWTTRTARRLHQTRCYASGSFFGMASAIPVNEPSDLPRCACPGVDWSAWPKEANDE